MLIAARHPFREHGALSTALPEPYRMVRVEVAGLLLSGIYMPNLLAKVPYWQALIAALVAAARWLDAHRADPLQPFGG